MIDIFILKIENPDCFWVHIKGGGRFLENETDYKKLHKEMNLFYNKSCRGVDEVKPSVLEEGQVCVVYSQELKSWCRAIVKSIVSCTDCYLVECFLVDHAKSVPVKADRICIALESFMRLPYRAKKFRLYCTKPVTLRVDYSNNSAEIVPANRWDVAAIKYFQNLLNDAAVSDNAEKVKHESIQETASHNAVTESNVVVTVPPLEKGITVAVQADRKNKSTLHQKITQKQNEIEKGLDKKAVCLKLLQFLNPDPLKASERHDEKEELLRDHVLGPNHIQSYSWPPIARGCDSVIISPENDPLVYLPPLITFLQSRSCYVSLPARNGPVALIICPGWKKAEQVFELLEIYTRCSRPLHPQLLLLGLNKEEIKSMRLPRGCEVIITTPHNVLRLLECHSLLFLKLCHLVFDEVEVLFSEANEQMLNILEYYKNHLSIEERESAPRQIVAIGSHWNKNLECLTQEFMNDPYVVITSMEEAAIYGNVQQMVQLCLECDKVSTLLQVLDFTPTSAQKTLIFTSSKEETDMVFKVLSLQQGEPKAKSILLLTEKTACHAAGVLRYLERTNAKIPPELYDFIAGVLEAKEDSKSGRPLCHYLKTFGICKDKNRCPDRHRINLQIDSPRKVTDETLPTAGNVTMLPLFIVDATRYFGRIVGKLTDQYTTLAEELNEYYKKTSNLISVDTVEKLAVCGLQEEHFFHRVQVLEVGAKEENCVFYSVHIRYIDEGRSGQVQNYQLLHLPEKFQALPPQAVEFIVCRVKPIDKETEWHPKVTRYIHQKIRGKPHEAKIVLTLENTIWVDPMVRVTRLLDLKTSINEYNVCSEILSTGMGVDNPEHTQELQKLFQNAAMAPVKKDLPPFFYPIIKWYDKRDVTVLKIKLQDVTNYDCRFFTQRIVFSAFAGGKSYLADMELQGNILKEKSACLLKSGEPMIILAKEEEEPWRSLLKLKNPNVTYDFDYLEDSEQESPFPVGTGPKKVYQLAAEDEEEEDQSSKDSDTESDDLSGY
ncbi:PREDICTED: putative ATP-dependent RNA helicase TDRD12 [Gekko japonicus]|uniref:RNA helicase n=1 Tax=Gekko japonicus TaxID=146911 RepID=A0ABM1K9D1_GEKJA|nr:PREDICTED: putative ATP-dependent RNA helicase TDRD12 [Gekko japonicus]